MTFEVFCWAPDRLTMIKGLVTARYAIAAQGEDQLTDAEVAALTSADGISIFGIDGVQIVEIKDRMKTLPVEDDQGNITTPAVMYPGYHVNARVYGLLAEQMTYGLPQVDEDGNELSIWDRTWARSIHPDLVYKEVTENGVTVAYEQNKVLYYDKSAFDNRIDTWQ